jgi:hypothetical protein
MTTGGASVDLDVIFAYVVGMLAGLAVIGLLVFVLVWEWCAIRRTVAAHRSQARDGYWRERGVLVATIPAKRAPIREGARRVVAGDSLRGVAMGWRGRGRHGRPQP